MPVVSEFPRGPSVLGGGGWSPLWEQEPIALRWAVSERGSKFYCVCVKVVSLANTGAEEAVPSERLVILIPFSHVTIFSCV